MRAATQPRRHTSAVARSRRRQSTRNLPSRPQPCKAGPFFARRPPLFVGVGHKHCLGGGTHAARHATTIFSRCPRPSRVTRMQHTSPVCCALRQQRGPRRHGERESPARSSFLKPRAEHHGRRDTTVAAAAPQSSHADHDHCGLTMQAGD